MNPIVAKGINLTLEAIGKSQIAKESIAKIESHLDHVDEIHRIEPMSIDALAESLSDSIDQQVMAVADTENLKPLGGELKAIYVNDCVELHLKNYFNNIDNKVILKESKKVIDKAYLDEESIDKVRCSEVIYPISPPARR